MHVSVIIPAFNASKTIADTLQSLVMQTSPDWEAIIVDDGSTDGTDAVARECAGIDQRFLIVQQVNGGEAAARNTGIHRARYDWLLFLDSDDWISPVYLQRMTAKLVADPTLDAVHCAYARVTADRETVVEKYQPPSGDLFPILARRAAFPVHACIVRKSLVEQIGGFDVSLKTSPDWDLWQRIARTGAQFYAIPEVLAFYRMSPKGASLDADQLFKDGLRVLKQGHAPDLRVPKPHPKHIKGLPRKDVRTQEFYLLSWCAGLLIGSGRDAKHLFKAVGNVHYPELHPDFVAQCLFESAPLPSCKPPQAWDGIWAGIQENLQNFLAALERRSLSPELAALTLKSLKKMVLRNSLAWRDIFHEHELLIDQQSGTIDKLRENTKLLEDERSQWKQTAEERERVLNEQKRLIEDLENTKLLLEDERSQWRLTAEERERVLNEQKWLIKDLGNTKLLLEDERSQWKRTAEEHERVLNEQKRLIKELGDTKLLLEDERSQWKLTDEEREEVLNRQKLLIGELERIKRALEEERNDWKHTAEDRESVIGGQVLDIQNLRNARKTSEEKQTSLERESAGLREKLRQGEAERNELLNSYEHQVGDLILRRMRMRKPLLASINIWTRSQYPLSIGRLAADSRIMEARKHTRILTTICTNFPIYSQTFVYQELTQLARQGFDVRLIYSKLDSRDQLSSQFDCLWKIKRRMAVNRKMHERDFARYQSRFGKQIESLIEKLCQASGLSRQDLISHDNFLQAFTFTRLVEAYRPHYIHSYFFYDRSLMALVAGYLLGIPRGISCYADHLLKDYELKVVPLHLELCNIVIATSERIRQELLQIAPNMDSGRIIVKPNGIDTKSFPCEERPEPQEGAPFRLITVCRIEPKKGLLDFVDAVDLLRKKGLKIEGHIVGTVDEWSQASRDYKQALDQRISELGLWGTMHLEGRQNLNGVHRFLSISHLFVAPFVETESGDKDGIPTALLEAMASGLPAVATDAGSISEVIKNGEDGVVVPQHQPQVMAEAIEALLQTPEKRAELGRIAADKVRRCYDASSCEKVFHDRLRAVVFTHRIGATS
jgi:glycosyltransferase involved in cell wall biosynthesis